MSERKYGPKPGVKNRDKTAKRYVARRATFGEPKSGYVPQHTSKAPERPTATGYIKRTYTPRGPLVRMSGIRTEVRIGKAGYTPRHAAQTFTQKSTSWSKSKTRNEKFTKTIHKSVIPNKPKTASASWGSVASWYDKHLNEADTYHEKVILPNLLRLIDPTADDHIIDLACGQGYFTRALAKAGAKVEGIDIAPELIDIARKESPDISYHVGGTEALTMLRENTFTKALITLAIQNIEHIEETLREASRVLRSGGELHIVMNHPAFRIPKSSSWEYDDKKKVQFRRIDRYLSNSHSAIDMHPGFTDSPQTISFHRPLQFYFKALTKAGFSVTRLEEWISHKTSDSGPRAKAENDARKEIPLFLYLRAIKQ